MRFCLTVSLTLLFLCSSLAMAADKLVLIGKNNPINDNDRILMEHLQALGLDVEYHSEPESHPVDLTNAAGVFISESVTSGNIGTAYELSIPVIMSEGGLIDDMKMGTGENADNSTTVTITDPSHSITKGFSGDVQVLSQPGILTGSTALEGDVQVLATLAGDATRAMVFVYEKGAQMQGQQALERRAFVFNHQNANPLLNDNGWMIVGRVVMWALSLEATSVAPEAALATTWGTLKSD